MSKFKDLAIPIFSGIIISIVANLLVRMLIKKSKFLGRFNLDGALIPGEDE